MRGARSQPQPGPAGDRPMPLTQTDPASSHRDIHTDSGDPLAHVRSSLTVRRAQTLREKGRYSRDGLGVLVDRVGPLAVDEEADGDLDVALVTGVVEGVLEDGVGHFGSFERVWGKAEEVVGSTYICRWCGIQ